MVRKSLLKKISALTVLTLLCSSLSSLISFADENEVQGSTIENVLASESVEGISTDVELDEKVLSEDFDLEEAVESMPSVDEMTTVEQELFDSIVEEQVALAGLENEEEEKLFAEAMVNFFDEDSETYNDLTVAQTELEEEIEEVNTSVYNNEEVEVSVKDVLNATFGVETAHAFQVKVGVKFAGAVFNGAIGFAIGGGVGAIQSFILKKGKKEAERLFTRTVVSRLKAWGAPKLALVVGACVTVALNYLDVGTQIAKQIDKKDKRPSNGWIDLY
ncbi:hypothetical protein [Metabacillus indicus]|uniref:hypothetical protein n=1 Tax=Metabacillus indicus TaxID=246786 RepID=UPI002492FE57|nr:hypothetical protein [Metabacillus indicus]